VHVWREGGGERGGKRERWRERKEVETRETRYTSWTDTEKEEEIEP